MGITATVSHSLSATSPNDTNYEVRPEHWNSGHFISVSFDASIGLNTAITGGSMTGNSSGLSINLPAYLTTAALSGDTSKYFQDWKLTGNTAGTTSSAQGTDFWLSAGNSITLSGSSNSIVFSVGAYITTADLSQNSSLYAGTGFTSTTTAGTQIKATHNTAGLSLNYPAWLTTADLSANSSNYISAWGLTSNTAGTTSSAQGVELWLAGGQGITLSGSSNTITFSVGSYITTADLSANSSNYARNWKLTSNTAGTTSSAIGTDLWLAGGQGITLSGSSNTITFSVGSYITTGDLSANSSNYARNWKLTGNSAGTQSSAIGTDLWLAGGNSITLSGSSNSISFSVGNYITTADLSQNSSLYYQSVSLLGNTAGTTTFSGTRINLSGVGGITLSGNASTIVVSAVAPATISSYENGYFANTQTASANGASVSLAGAFQLPQAGSFSFLRMPIVMSTTSQTLASNATLTSGGGFVYSTWNAVVYSLGTGGSSKSLQSVVSGSVGFTQSLSYSFSTANSAWSVTQGITGNNEGSTNGQTTQYSATSASLNLSTNYLSNYSGNRMLDINFANSLSPGPYWLIFGYSSSSTTSGQGGATLMSAQASYSQHLGVLQIASTIPEMGIANNASFVIGGASFSTAGGGTTNSIPIANLSTNASHWRPYFQLLRSA